MTMDRIGPGLALLTVRGLATVVLLAACSPAASAPARPAVSAPGAASAAPTGPSPAAAAPAVAATAPASPPARAGLRLAVQGRPDQAHLQLALDRGYFAEQGLDVETVQITSGAEMVPALATDQIQVGNGAP